MDIVLIILAVIGGATGIITSIYCFASMPIIIVWKFYRKIKYKISMFD